MYIYRNVNNSFFKFDSYGKVTEDEIVTSINSCYVK